MKVLFTKNNLDTEIISEKIGDHFSYDFVEVIEIKPLSVPHFDLKDSSLIFTSVNAVESFFQNGFLPNEDFTSKNFNKIYCVGQKTKKRIRDYGFGTFKVKKHARELCDFIIDHSGKERFLHFCGNLALDVLDKALPLQNISYRKIFMYETTLLYPKIEKNYDAVVFFSPSGVRSFIKHNSLESKKIFSIGLTTSEEIEKHTDSKIITSKEISLDDVLKLISKEAEKQNKN